MKYNLIYTYISPKFNDLILKIYREMIFKKPFHNGESLILLDYIIDQLGGIRNDLKTKVVFEGSSVGDIINNYFLKYPDSPGLKINIRLDKNTKEEEYDQINLIKDEL